MKNAIQATGRRQNSVFMITQAVKSQPPTQNQKLFAIITKCPRIETDAVCISSGSAIGKYSCLICGNDMICSDVGISDCGIKHNRKTPNKIFRLTEK
jgi:hypothetical protein